MAAGSSYVRFSIHSWNEDLNNSSKKKRPEEIALNSMAHIDEIGELEGLKARVGFQVLLSLQR